MLLRAPRASLRPQPHRRVLLPPWVAKSPLGGYIANAAERLHAGKVIALVDLALHLQKQLRGPSKYELFNIPPATRNAGSETCNRASTKLPLTAKNVKFQLGKAFAVQGPFGRASLRLSGAPRCTASGSSIRSDRTHFRSFSRLG
jgi:hypothetical protein